MCDVRTGIALAALLLAACSPEETPESQVRAVISAGEQAAEARDLSDLMALVSPAYGDEQGNGPTDLERYLRGYLVIHQSVHLLVKVGSVTFPFPDMARVDLTLGTLGTGNSAATALDLAGDVYDVHLELMLEDGDWRVSRARWAPAQGG